MVGRLRALGITDPLPVQEATIPAALSGRDVCAQAPTGSGKTLAFGLPVVTAAGAPRRTPQALVVVPTRELADQVRDALSQLFGPGPDRVVAVYGGVGYGPQRHALRRGADVVVGCPGRLEDLVGRGDLRLGDVRTVVLDEADRMVDMGFLQPVCRLLDQTSADRQVLMFSATMGAEVESISRRYQQEPLRHRIEAEPGVQSDVTHHFWRVSRAERIKLTAELIAHHGQAFVFCRTKFGADRVTRQLRAAGVTAAPIHGDRTQPQRTRALASFVEGRTDALVGTDVVARGIHVDDIPCVVHFDLPNDAADYIHRSGRTGRAGAAGVVVSLVPEGTNGNVRALQKALGLPERVTKPVVGPVASGAASVSVVPRTAPARLQGTVKFFDGRRGFGFLSAPNGADVFVHHSNVEQHGAGRPMLRTGDRVTFETAPGRRGTEARSVLPVGNGRPGR